MPNPVNEQAAYSLGIQVERATATLPQTASAAIFTVAGGRVLLKQIIGEITVIMGGVANNTSLEGNPTTGTLETLCAVLNTANYAAGDLLGITGVMADAMVPAATGGALQGMAVPIVLKAGTLDLRCAANNTGSVRWTVYYTPLDAGATMVAA